MTPQLEAAIAIIRPLNPTERQQLETRATNSTAKVGTYTSIHYVHWRIYIL